MEVLKESGAGCDGLAGLLPGDFQAVANRVEGKGQQVHRGEDPGQVLFAVSEVVGQVIAVILQHAEALILPSFCSSSIINFEDLYSWLPSSA